MLAFAIALRLTCTVEGLCPHSRKVAPHLRAHTMQDA
jgi:hypothetical protein